MNIRLSLCVSLLLPFSSHGSSVQNPNIGKKSQSSAQHQKTFAVYQLETQKLSTNTLCRKRSAENSSDSDESDNVTERRTAAVTSASEGTHSHLPTTSLKINRTATPIIHPSAGTTPSEGITIPAHRTVTLSPSPDNGSGKTEYNQLTSASSLPPAVLHSPKESVVTELLQEALETPSSPSVLPPTQLRTSKEPSEIWKRMYPTPHDLATKYRGKKYTVPTEIKSEEKEISQDYQNQVLPFLSAITQQKKIHTNEHVSFPINQNETNKKLGQIQEFPQITFEPIVKEESSHLGNQVTLIDLSTYALNDDQKDLLTLLVAQLNFEENMNEEEQTYEHRLAVKPLFSSVIACQPTIAEDKRGTEEEQLKLSLSRLFNTDDKTPRTPELLFIQPSPNKTLLTPSLYQALTAIRTATRVYKDQSLLCKKPEYFEIVKFGFITNNYEQKPTGIYLDELQTKLAKPTHRSAEEHVQIIQKNRDDLKEKRRLRIETAANNARVDRYTERREALIVALCDTLAPEFGQDARSLTRKIGFK